MSRRWRAAMDRVRPAAMGRYLWTVCPTLARDCPKGHKAEASPASGPNQDLVSRRFKPPFSDFSPSIRRMCWQPALSRHGGESGGARVSTTVTIAPAGKVTAVAHEGDPAGYPGLASCIALRVKTWILSGLQPQPRSRSRSSSRLSEAYVGINKTVPQAEPGAL